MGAVATLPRRPSLPQLPWSSRYPDGLHRPAGAGSPSPCLGTGRRHHPLSVDLVGSVEPRAERPATRHLGLLLRPSGGALFHGHLYLPNGTLGIEAFLHDGHQFTYFGLFPSLLRMPVLLVTSRLDGRLTAPSMLLSWVVTGVFSSLLLWRLRLLIRGQAVMRWAEAVPYGLFVATVGGGSCSSTCRPLRSSSTRLLLGAWRSLSRAVHAARGAGTLRRGCRPPAPPACLILAANLDRTPAGWGCVIAAGLVAAGSPWAGAVRTIGAGPAHDGRGGGAVRCRLRSHLRQFGIPIGLPMADQVWAQLNAHRRYFLVANGGKAFSPAFLPSPLVAYLQPFGIHISGVFPFITLPTAPAAATTPVQSSTRPIPPAASRRLCPSFSS